LRANSVTRVALSIALFLGVASLLAFHGIEVARVAGRRLGFVPGQGPEGVLVASVSAGLPAARAGLHPGDQILAVDGMWVETPVEYDEAARRYERGRPVVLRIRREGRELDVRVTPGAPPRWGLFLLDVLTALCFLAVALLALPPGLDGDLRARLLLGFAGAVALEVSLPLSTIGRPGLSVVVLSAFYLLTGLQIGLQLHLASLIPERPDWLQRRPWVIPLYYTAGLGLGLASCATLLEEEVLGKDLFPWTLEQIDTLLLRFGIPVWALAVSVLLARQALRHSEPRGRHQAGLVLAATLLWLVFTATMAVFELLGLALPLWITGLETLVLLGYPVAFFAAIFRYHLFDIEMVVRRGLIYTTLTGALVLVFYAAVGAGGALFSYLLGGKESVWAVSVATLVLGLLFAPLRRALHRLIDRRFFPERYALRQRLIGLAGELPALGKLPRMGEHLVKSLREIFLARSATLLIADPETGLLGILAATNGKARSGGEEPPLLVAMEDPAIDHLRRSGRPLPAAQLAPRSLAFAHRLRAVDPASLMVPLLNQEKLIGVLIVGPKEGRRKYPAEEQDLLNLLAHHVATVFENARLFESATYESLTGLLRREAILEQLDRELERALRYGRPLTVAMADLDHFKGINDRHGHLAGDTLLRRISQIVAGGLRNTDSVGRYGGEEFLLVLPETDILGAATVAEKIRTLVQRTVVPIEDGTAARVTISIGLASLEEVVPREGGRVTARDLIAAADRSLYEAKNGGRNRVHPLVAVA
jgi:diguanylate cyclase (GGDEF)-like protein